jgi:cyclopropane fatty-acyl-phospholipid synthase-like methyltransferase
VTPRQLAFRVEGPLELHGWRVLDIDATVPLTRVERCPAGDADLRTLCTFVGRDANVTVRVGCCPSCGHVSYIDRPTAAWMNDYYLDSWDAEDVEARSEKRLRKLTSTKKREKSVVTLAKALPVDKSRPLCEIGVGWGLSLKHLIDAGFERAVGTETSKHRADVVRSGLGVPVFTAPFESAETRKQLASFAPFSVIVSNHVFEHTYHPGDVFAAAAALQADGDYLIVAVPNQQTEQAMSVLFFLPHMHSFTQASLARTAARHGYVVHDDSHMHPKQVLLVFRKTAATTAEAPALDPAFDATVAQYATELGLDRWHIGTRRLWWLSRGGATGQRWMLGSGRWEEARWRQWLEREGHDSVRALAIRGARRRRTTVSQSPFEIQFAGPIGLFYK